MSHEVVADAVEAYEVVTDGVEEVVIDSVGAYEVVTTGKFSDEILSVLETRFEVETVTSFSST